MADSKETAVLESKPFYKSKIVWLALTTIFVGASEQLSVLGQFLPAEYQGLFTTILGAAVLIARSYSTTNITLKKIIFIQSIVIFVFLT